MKLTSLDRNIIALLNQDARTSSAEVARLTGATERTVRNRINRLFAEGIIRPVAVVDPRVFGYTMVIDIYCQVDLAHREEVLEALSRLPEVSYIAFTSGDPDISIQALFRDSAEMHTFITHRLYHIPGILRARTELVPTIVKSSYQWLPPVEAFISD